MRETLPRVARVRSDYAGELQRHVESLGGGAAQRPHCGGGDESTVKHYEHAPAEQLSQQIMGTVQRQLEGVVDALDEVRDLEHQPA